MKAVIYARYSSDNQREASIEGQIRECTAFAEKNGITVLRHYIDRAVSAKTDNRPEFQNMIKDSNKKLFDMIIVWKLDRFARNRYDSARYKAQLKKNGVKVVSATEVISDGAEGIILESMLEGFAEYYSVDLSEKVVRGMTDNALKCMFNGGTLPMGYVIDAEQHFQIDPVTAPYILGAFKQYDEGATMTQIRDWLNEQGMKNTRGNPLTYNSVQHLLKNRRYIGEYQYRDILIPDGIPAIVPKDLFDRVQAKMEKNKKAPARHKAEDDYLLTTKLFCGYCGAYLCGESGTSRTGVVHHYYKCVSVKKKRKECHKKSVKKGWIENLVVSETMKIIMDDDAIEAIVSMLMELQEQDNTNIPLYERQLQETNTKIRNLINAIQQGILTKSTKASLEELEAAKEELENRLANEQLSKPPKVSAEFMTFWLHRFRKLDVTKQSHRKMLIDTFINAIYLYDDKMLITFNYKDGTKKITFSDIQEASKRDASGSDLDCSTVPNLLFLFGAFPRRERAARFFSRRTPALKNARGSGKIAAMKVLLINGSTKLNGCVFAALSEVASVLEKEGIGTEIVQLGAHPVRDCTGCKFCAGKGDGRCAFDDDVVNALLDKAAEADGFVFGSPVFYAHPSGQLLAVLDRMFYAGKRHFAYKPGAAVVTARRAGTTASLDVLNKYFTDACMPVVSSTYWNMAHGNLPEQLAQDEEGLQTMRNLGRNMAWLLKCIELGKKCGVPAPTPETAAWTSFVR